jgi:transcriptional regulator with XRE-family HTH domain
MEEDREIVVERLREAVGLIGSQASVARSLNKHKSRVSRWLSGEGEPDLLSLRRICDLANVSADWLLGLTDDPRSPRDRIGPLSLSGEEIRLLTEVMNRIIRPSSEQPES